jgi:hypothetical protein
MGDTDHLIDAALAAAATLPSPRAFQVWCDAYRAGRSAEEEAVKRAFRCVWEGLAEGRCDDFMRLLASAEARLTALDHQQIVGWTQAAAARAVLELIQSRRLQCSDAVRERRTRAADMAAAALRLAEAARQRAGRGTCGAAALR